MWECHRDFSSRRANRSLLPTRRKVARADRQLISRAKRRTQLRDEQNPDNLDAKHRTELDKDPDPSKRNSPFIDDDLLLERRHSPSIWRWSRRSECISERNRTFSRPREGERRRSAVVSLSPSSICEPSIVSIQQCDIGVHRCDHAGIWWLKRRESIE